MDPMIVPWDPLPGLILLLFSLVWAARRRLRSDLAVLYLTPDARPD